MSDYTEQVRALRMCMERTCPFCDFFDGNGCKLGGYMKMTLDAAAAIEALQAEVNKAEKIANDYRTMYFAKHGDITIEKVRELDEKDCHFHSALIRLMYRRIGELESAQPQRVQDGSISKFADGEWWKEMQDGQK